MSRLLLLMNDETTIYNFRREIVTAFVGEGHEVHLAYPLGEHTEEIQALGCNVVPVEVSRHGTSIVQDIKYFVTCIKLIMRINPDIVLTYTVKPNIYGSIACQITKKKYMNNITGLGSILQSDGIMARLILFLQKIGYRKSSHIFFQNQDNYQRLLENHVIRQNIPYTVLPGSGVNLKLHQFEYYPEEQNTIKFILVSRVRADKGFDEFFEMAQKVKSTHSNTEFHIVGWYEDEYYKKEIEKLQRDHIIEYHGKQDPTEVHRLLKESHCLIHPSYHEGMANVILEAAATGRPVLASDIPGCREGFEEGISGFGFHVKDSESLFNVVERFLNLPYEQKKEMGIRGREKMEREFDRQIVAQKYINEIKNLEEK